jgi:hypothetical protein
LLVLEILDAVIATAAVTLALALIVQAVQQIIKQIFDLKSSYMRVEMLALFGDDKASVSLPSWLINLMPLGRLAAKVDDVAKRIVRELEERMSTFGMTDLHLLQDVSADKLKEIVSTLPIARDASLKEQFEKAIARIDLWLEVSKKAFQEHYERRMKLWAIGISAVVVVAVNANIFDIYKEFSRNKALRETAIAMGERFISTSRDSLIVIRKAGAKDSTIAGAQADSLRKEEIKKQLGSIQSILDERSFQIMGWTGERLEKYRSRPWCVSAMMLLPGWIGMTLVVSLGAPFWYDFLKTVMGVKDMLKGGSNKKQNWPDIPPVG